jgi:glycosyltransferase involved in cell wall biosynthesis
MTPHTAVSLLPPAQPLKLDVCFVAPLAYGALADTADGHIGGVERQTRLMARWLASRGHRVTAVTWDEGQPDGATVAGVRLLKLCRRDAGVHGVRFLHPRWTSLVQALRRADATIYYQNSGECVTGQVALWCNRHGRRFIFSAASDHDCIPSLPYLKTFRERALYRYGLTHATRLIVQTRAQQRMFRQHFGLESSVVPMPCPGPAEDQFVLPQPMTPSTSRILWVGRLTPEKRPDRLLDLAEACSDLHFDLVGPAYDASYSRRILERAHRRHNITVHGAMTPGRLTTFYRRAACLCCTSDSEGFPNTFLEAWSYGLPVVSMFDPDHLLTEQGLGIAATDVPRLARAIQDLLTAPGRWRTASTTARSYYLRHHSVDRVMPLFEQMFAAAAYTGTTHDPGRRLRTLWNAPDNECGPLESPE